jgi:hypothetical protein
LRIFTKRPITKVEVALPNGKIIERLPETAEEYRTLHQGQAAQALEFNKFQCENLLSYDETQRKFVENYEKYGNVCGR